MQEISDFEHTCSLIVYKEDEVDSEKVSQMTEEMVDFGLVVAIKDKNIFLELNARSKKVLEAYEEIWNRIHQL